MFEKSTQHYNCIIPYIIYSPITLLYLIELVKLHNNTFILYILLHIVADNNYCYFILHTIHGILFFICSSYFFYILVISRLMHTFHTVFMAILKLMILLLMLLHFGISFAFLMIPDLCHFFFLL